MAFGTLGSSANQVLIKIKGNDKDYQNSLKKADSSTASFASKMKSYGPMIGAAFAAAAVGFVAMSVKMAAAEEAVSRQTEALLKSQGIMWGAVSGELDTYMKQLEELTAYNDTDLQVAFNSMIAAGMSYTEAMESMNTVTSMSFSLNRDLASMALLVGKAYNGQTGELSRYGIVLDESLDKTEKFTGLQKYVADNFADASERTDSFEGKMELLNSEMSNFAEAVGVELLPGLTDFVELLVEGADGSGSFATSIGQALGSIVGHIPKVEAIRALKTELHGLETLGYKTPGDETRMNEIRFEIQQRLNDQWTEYESNRVNANKEITDTEWEKAAAIYESLGYSREYLENLRAQTGELKNQTAELEKQLTMTQRAGRSSSSVNRNIGNASMSAETAAILGISNGNINPNITSSVQSGV